jgi:methyl-accepting chemotaxis protein
VSSGTGWFQKQLQKLSFTTIRDWRIGHKIRFSYLFVIVLFLVTSVTTFINLSNISSNATRVVDEAQPMVITSLSLKGEIEQSNSSMGLYLISGDEQHRDKYLSGLKHVSTMLEELDQNSEREISNKEASLINTLKSDLSEYSSYRDQILDLAGNVAKNYPGVAVAAQEINPRSREVLQMLTSMIQMESERGGAHRKLLQTMNNLRYMWANMMINIRTYLAFRNKTDLVNIQTYSEEVNRLLKKMEGSRRQFTFEQEMSFDEITSQVEAFTEGLKKMEDIYRSDEWRMDYYLIHTKIGPLVERIENNLNTLVDIQRDNIHNSSDDLIDTISSINIISLVNLVLVVVLSTIIGQWLTRVIAKPLQMSVVAMNEISNGDGDLTRRLPEKGFDEIGDLARSFNHFIDKIRAIIEQVSTSVSHLQETSTLMNRASLGAHEQMQAQSYSTNEVVSSFDKVFNAFQEIDGHVKLAADASSSASSRSVEVQQMTKKALETNTHLSSNMNETVGSIHKVVEYSENIGSVINLIEEIAEQTNLLALNAAIEAARAGDSGRGFAVVADEVRSLASRTQESVASVHEAISALQNQIEQAHGSIRESMDMSSHSTEVSLQADEALGTISDEIRQINGMSQEIASSVEQQAVLAEDLQRHIQTISNSTTSSSQHIETVRKESERLAELSLALDDLVGQFRLS